MESAVDDREEGMLNADSTDRKVQLMTEKKVFKMRTALIGKRS